MTDAMTAWLNQAGRYPLLSKTEIIELSRQRDNNAPGSRKYVKAINTICKHNLRLVHRVVRAYCSKRPTLSLSSQSALDLLQQGYFGLRRAAEKFDPARGYTFSTYAVTWIRQSVSRYATVNEHMIYVPEATVRELFYQKTHGKPSDRASSTLSTELVQKAARARIVSSLDARLGNEDDDSSTLLDLMDSDNAIIDPSNEEPSDPFAPVQHLMDEIGIAKRTQQIVRGYAKRGRMSIVANRLSLSPKHCQNLYREAVRNMKDRVAAKEAAKAARLSARLSV